MFLLGIILIVINLLLAVGIFYAIGQFGDTIEHAQYGYFFVLFFGLNVVYLLQSLA